MMLKIKLHPFSAIVLALLLCSGCAHHPAKMANIRILMADAEYQSAIKELEKTGGSEDDVLYLLERALLLHFAGEYTKSNEIFERAERLTEDLYTKSLSHEAGALLTSDLVLPYIPKPFEQMLINYYRALNYIYINSREDALVECRKASHKLAQFAEDDRRPFRHDAFIEYFTAILYEWGEEINDALVSYKNALDSYRTYRDALGIGPPPGLSLIHI